MIFESPPPQKMPCIGKGVKINTLFSSPYGLPANSLRCPLKAPDFSSMFDAFVRILLLLFPKILFHIRIALGLLFLKHILIMLLDDILLLQI